MKFSSMVFVLFCLALCSCQVEPTSATPVPTDTSSPRWMVYQQALSKAIIDDDGLCEWEILGQSDNEVYVWAYCMVREPIGSAAVVPVVIQLGKSGEIEKVTLPRDGINYPVDIRALFPKDVQDKILPHSVVDFSEMQKHLEERQKSNGPPLIAISGTSLP